jgi:hypothetical protein
MSGTPPRAIGDLLPTVVPHLGDRLVELRLRRAWPSLVGVEVARRSRPTTLAAGTLTVVADNSPWLHELTLRTEDLRRRIAERFPEVRAVRFTLGALEHTPDADAAPRRKAVALTDADRAEIESATAAIPDPTIAAAARRVMTKAWRYPAPRSQ